jgi:hypothetical protein
MGKMRNAYDSFVGEPKRNRLFGNTRCRWKDYIKMYIEEIG